MDKTTIAILGGEGFIGKNIGESLGKKYACFSIALGRSLFSKPDISFLQNDPYVQKIDPSADILIHLIDNPLAEEAFEAAERKLIEYTFTSNLKRVIIFSSSVVYASPNSDYGLRKRSLEKIYQDACEERGISLTIFRLFNTFGKYQLPYRRGSLIANLIYDHMTNKVTEVSNVLNTRDFVFAGDIGKFIDHVIEKGLNGTYDLSSNHAYQLKEIIDILEAELPGGKLSLRVKDEPIDNGPVGENPFLAEISLIPLKDALRQTVEFYRNDPRILKAIENSPKYVA